MIMQCYFWHINLTLSHNLDSSQNSSDPCQWTLWFKKKESQSLLRLCRSKCIVLCISHYSLSYIITQLNAKLKKLQTLSPTTNSEPPTVLAAPLNAWDLIKSATRTSDTTTNYNSLFQKIGPIHEYLLAIISKFFKIKIA